MRAEDATDRPVSPSPSGSDVFSEQRARLFDLAYRMLGSVADAEDMVQETYLRWRRQDPTAVTSPRGWLVTVLTRLCLDHLKSARQRREEYVGVWLPEPLVDTAVPAPDASAALADSLRVAFLVLLDDLAPVERAVFLLREVFSYGYDEIAEIVGRSEAACRQVLSRAKARLGGSGPVERGPRDDDAEQLVRRFLDACLTGELTDLLALLTDDAVLYSDGGGRVRAALRPIRSADRIGRFFHGIRHRGLAGVVTRFVRVNGERGVFFRRRDGTSMVMTFAFAGERIRAIYMVMNPDKLRHLPAAG